MTMTPEEKNARMTEERTFLTKLLESSLQGKLDVVKEHVAAYQARHPTVSQNEILGQFKDGKKRTALYFMCQSNAPNILDDLVDWLDKDFLISLLKEKDINGMTALMICAQHPDPQLACRRVKLLLDVGGKHLALVRSNIGAGALHYAAGAGALPETIHVLVQAGRVALATLSIQGGTPLHWAAALSGNHTDTLQALLDDGADMNSKNENALTPLLLAAAAGNDTHAKFMLQHGADIEWGLPGSVSIFHMAADCNLVGTLAVLLELYPNSHWITQKNSRGETPLDLAVQEDHVACVMLLTREGDEAKAKAWMQQHKLSLPERQEHHHDDTTLHAPQLASTQEPAKCNLFEEHAKELGAKAAAAQVTDESKKLALGIKQEGNQFFANKEWKMAIDSYTKAIEEDPTDATFYSNRSACYMHIEDYDAALQDAVICRQLKPDWPKACYRMAVARYSLKRYEDAALSAWEGLKLDEQNSELKQLLQKCVKKGRKVHQETVQRDHDNS
jgi:ankyrin repeat protein